MTRLLHIESSPRPDTSASQAVARSFLESYSRTSSSREVETLDLWHTELPRYDEEMMRAKYRLLHGQPHTPTEAQTWSSVVAVADQFKRADALLFSVPMWNFGIPYVLKHYLDVLIQPGLTFGFTPGVGYVGLVTGRPAVLICARGGEYDNDAARALDFQKPYLECLLRFIGFTDIRTIFVEPTLGDEGACRKAVESAKEQAVVLGRDLA